MCQLTFWSPETGDPWNIFLAAHTHEKGRPASYIQECERLTDSGTWILDDGKPGLAFSGRAQAGYPVAVTGHCRCWDRECPSRMAMDRTSNKYHCANGRYFEDKL